MMGGEHPPRKPGAFVPAVEGDMRAVFRRVAELVLELEAARTAYDRLVEEASETIARLVLVGEEGRAEADRLRGELSALRDRVAERDASVLRAIGR
jgi:ABC-type transporter Mla subunit MlaD